MKLYLGILLLIIGILGLYSTATSPLFELTHQNELFHVMLVEIKRNRIITSALVLIAGLVLIIERRNEKLS